MIRALCLAICLAATHARAAERVDLEIVLAVDVSASIGEAEARRQREVYVAALAYPDVIGAIHNSGHGRIAVTYMEWADPSVQRLAEPWTLIEDEEDALAFAAIPAPPIIRMFK